MATFTTIADTVLEPGKPIRSVDTLALRDNPIAIAEGAAGAPKVVTNALATNERMTTANVLSAYAGASPAAVGTYTVAYFPNVGGRISINAGTTIAGSSVLRAVGTRHVVGSLTFTSSGTESAGFTGTWRLMASIRNPTTTVHSLGALLLRIS